MANLRKRRYTNEQFIDAVKTNKSWRQVIYKIGLVPAGGNYVHAKSLAKALNLDTSHFTGRGWCRGELAERLHRAAKIPLEEILIKESTHTNTNSLRKRLIKEGLKEHKCEECKRTTWNGKTIPIQLDHINGDRQDNRIENLRILCPNCHAQTNTYCGKNKYKN